MIASIRADGAPPTAYEHRLRPSDKDMFLAFVGDVLGTQSREPREP